MSKADDLLRKAGANIHSSLGVGVTPGTAPPGIDPTQASRRPARLEGLVKNQNAAEIPLSRIASDPDQPREQFDPDGLDRLAESLKTRGVLQPIRVRWDEATERYILIAGERRWRAAQKAGLERIPCTIHQGSLDTEELLALQLIENVLREDLQPIEQAKGYRKLMQARGWSARELARELHLSPSNVHRALELLELPAPVQDLVEAGNLAPSAANEIGRLGIERADDQVELARQAVAQNLPRADVVAAVKAHKEGRAPAAKPAKVEFKLDDGTKVVITGPMVLSGPEAVVEALKRVTRKAQAEARAGRIEAA